MRRIPLVVLAGLGGASLAASVGPAAAAPSAPPHRYAGLPDGVPPAALKPEPSLPVPTAWPFPDAFPRTSGASRLVSGAYEYSGFLYGDHGATGVTIAAPVAGLAPTVGTYAYPAGPAMGNGANIFRAAIGRAKGGSWWRVDWNTLADPNVPIAEFGLDTGKGSVTPQWPAGAGVKSAGLDTAILMSAKGAWLVDPATGARIPLPSLVVDTNARSFVVSIPSSLLDPTGTWKVRLVAGLADATGASFRPVGSDLGALPGQPNVFDVGFRTYRQEPEVNNFWMERQQATILSTADVTPFAATVTWADLAHHKSTPEPLPTGYTNRWYVSSIETGQGIAPSSSVSSPDPVFRGRVQPYAVYVPTTYAKRAAVPLTWILHSLGVQHNQYGAINPKFVLQACERRHSICATTLGRGPGGWYYDAAELDFWEIWNRLAGAYRLDSERTTISGYSMGGWATYKLGLAHPDLFAKALVLEGPAICGARVAPGINGPAMGGRCATDGDSLPLVDSARNLPYVISQGAVDLLVPVTGIMPNVMKFDSLGYQYRFELYPAADHLAYILLDGFSEQATQLNGPPRVRDPGHVTYAWYPNLDRSDYGIGSTGAYWVRDTRGRVTTPGSLSRVDAVSLARPEAITPVQTFGALVPGDPFPAVTREQSWKRSAPPVAQPVVRLSLQNVGALGIDLARAGIVSGRGASLPLTSDGPVALSLLSAKPGAAIALDGRTVGRAGSDGGFTVSVPTGAHTVTVD
ncbi:MAG: hypothetical protein NVSMB12_18040 [Acidimicrobiales bacterium]